MPKKRVWFILIIRMSSNLSVALIWIIRRRQQNTAGGFILRRFNLLLCRSFDRVLVLENLRAIADATAFH